MDVTFTISIPDDQVNAAIRGALGVRTPATSSSLPVTSADTPPEDQKEAAAPVAEKSKKTDEHPSKTRSEPAPEPLLNIVKQMIAGKKVTPQQVTEVCKQLGSKNVSGIADADRNEFLTALTELSG